MQHTQKTNSVTIQVSSLERKTVIALSNITEYFETEKRRRLAELLRSGSSTRNIAHYHQTALNQMTAQLVAEAKQVSPRQQQGRCAERRRFRQWFIDSFFRQKHTNQQSAKGQQLKQGRHSLGSGDWGGRTPLPDR